MMKPFQHDLAEEPFWMLVGCILANRGSWEHAAPLFDYVKTRVKGDHKILAEIQYGRENGTPECVMAYSALERTLGPLGLAATRTNSICRLASAWAERESAGRLPEDYREVEALPGCGRYAAEAWRIFLDGDVNFEPQDKILALYVAQRQAEASGRRGSSAKKAKGAPDPADKKKKG